MMNVQEKPFKTRCYYTDYVNHMIRFYLTCPDAVMTAGKRRSDIENWLAVQSVMHILSDADRGRIVEIYKMHYNLPKAVSMYCEKYSVDEKQVWILITRVAATIARRRGLV